MTRRAIQMMFVGAVLLAAAFVLAACSAATTVAPPPPAPTQAPVACPTAAACPVVPPAPTAVPVKPAAEAPFQKLWEASGHADKKAEAFVHWNTPVAPATVGEVPVGCAMCHSSTGFQEFVATGKVSKNQPIGTTVECATCHNDATLKLTSVTFPSGAVINNLGPEARCMTCHDGRASGKTITDLIAKFKATDADKVVDPIKNADGSTSNFSLQTAHYFTAALTLYGTDVKGGYEYPGQAYDVKNQHTPEFDTCATCHNPHSLQVQVDKCAECHTGVKTVEDLKTVREPSSVNDFNGNGDVKEGIYAEVKGVQAILQKAIYTYAKEVAGVGIVYDGATYPYWFQDKDGDGKADKDDKNANISFTKVTPRLLQAAFNYVVVDKDPGAFAHNPKYVIQLMYDGIADLNTKLTTKIDMSKMHRDDAGHFAGSGMPFRDWDGEGEVPYGCAKCHSSTGLPEFIANGGSMVIAKNGTLNITGIGAQPVADGFLCTTCHNAEKFPAVLSVVNVPFPNGGNLTFSTKKDDKGALIAENANICIECHQGRQSTTTMNNYLSTLKDSTPDKVDSTISFKNVHYFSAGATLFGTAAKGIYEYTGQTYVGPNTHVDGFTTCIQCHDKHSLEVKADKCSACHKEAATSVEKIRMTKENYDGSTDAAEPMADVVKAFQKRLYAAILKYATDKSKLGIVYDAATNPYFFVDKDGDGKADKDDKGALVRYNAFTPRLLEAAYNYQYSVKDPGAFAHNPKYVLQALYDSTKDLGGDVTGLVRPTTPATK